MKKYILRVVSDLGFALIMFVLKLSVRQQNKTYQYIYNHLISKWIDYNDHKIDDLILSTQKNPNDNSTKRKGC